MAADIAINLRIGLKEGLCEEGKTRKQLKYLGKPSHIYRIVVTLLYRRAGTNKISN